MGTRTASGLAVMVVAAFVDAAYPSFAQTVEQRLEEARAIQYENPDGALEILNGFLAPGAESERAAALFDILHLRGSILRNLGRMDEAMADAEKLGSIARPAGRDDWVAMALHLRGTILHELGSSSDALIAFHEAHAILRETSRTAQLARTLMAIGVVHTDMGDAARGEPYYRQALGVAREAGDRGMEMYVLGNLGHAVHQRDGPEASLPFHLEALEIERELGNPSFAAYQMSSICDRYIELQEIERADRVCRQALEMVVEVGHSRLAGFTHLSLGGLATERGDIGRAESHFREALAIGREIQRHDLIAQALESLASVAESRGDLGAALTLTKETAEVKARHREIERRDTIDRLELRYEADARNREIELLRLQRDNTALESGRRSWMLGTVIAVLVLVLFLSTLVWRRYRSRVLIEAARNRALEEDLTTITRLAGEDALTGLANRRLFDELAAHEVARAKRLSTPLALVFGDIDHFKVLNDEHGHETGDAVLQVVAATLKASVRDVDIVCRWGGEEFALLLPDTSLEGAVRCVERIRAGLAKTVPAAADGIRITATFGIVHVTESLDEAIRAADKAMYEGKRLGRDRIITSDDLAKLQ